jgi:hypothetical protein
LDLDIPGSDLDIICEVHDLETFSEELMTYFGNMPGFRLRIIEKNGLPTCVCNFDTPDFAIEIFGQARPASAQNAVVHMIVEGRLLKFAGPEAAESIRQLKLGGLKTEPAFAHYFGLQGDPYQALLDLAGRPDADLQALVQRLGK